MRHIVISELILLALMPVVLLAKSLVPCDTDCHVPELFTLASNVMEFVVTYLAAPLAAIMFVYAGVLYLFDGGKGSNITKARNILTSTVLGLFFILGAYLIVKAIIVGLAGGSQSGRYLLDFFR